jgi:hypothetical protein
MRRGRIIYILLCFLFLNACVEEKIYVLEGNIRGLVDPILYIMPFGSKTDTIYSKHGEFRYEGVSDSIQPVQIGMEDSSVSAWITVWAQNGQVIEIYGNADYPELITSNGNEVNDLLTGFRHANNTIIKEWNDTDDKKRKEELMKILIQDSQFFIRNHPSSIASLVLIQDYLVKSEDLDVVTDALSLIVSPAKDSELYRQLRTVY